MTPFDTKNYRAREPGLFSNPGWCVIAIVAFVILLGWMGERDREMHIKRVQEAAQCR